MENKEPEDKGVLGWIAIENFILKDNFCIFSCLKIETDYNLFLDKFKFLSTQSRYPVL